MSGPLRIATRGSALALAQSGLVAARITALTGRETELVRITTHGDVSPASLAELGGTGAFATAVREAVLAGQCDVAVHSLKDLPVAAFDGLTIAAIPAREDARDALCARDGLTLAALAPGSRLGTGSPRRGAQALRARPDLEVIDIRGNVDTRLGRVGDDLDAVVLALAGLLRLGREGSATEAFDLSAWPTAAGQGALAVEIRSADADGEVGLAVSALDDGEARATATAERAVLAGLEAGCSAPVGVTASLSGERFEVLATVYSPDGKQALTAKAAAETGGATAGPDLARRVVSALFAEGAAEVGGLGRDRD